MTTPTGQIAMSDVNVEIGRAWNATTSLGESAVRTLAGLSSGYVDMWNLRGKSSYVAVSAKGNDYWAQGATNSTSYPNSFSASARPSVTPSGGTGSYTYAWTVTGGTAYTLSNASSQTCTVTKTIPRSGDYAVVTLQCVVSDGRTSVTVTGIQAGFDYETSR